jgi:hypothetical protein
LNIPLHPRYFPGRLPPEIVAAEKINASYVSCVLYLRLLAPDIIEATLDGRHPAAMRLAVLMRPFAVGDRQMTIRLPQGTSRREA